MLLGHIPDLPLPVSALQSRHQRNETWRAIKLGCKFRTSPFSGVRMAELSH
jgi:hypothetical protein